MFYICSTKTPMNVHRSVTLLPSLTTFLNAGMLFIEFQKRVLLYSNNLYIPRSRNYSIGKYYHMPCKEAHGSILLCFSRIC